MKTFDRDHAEEGTVETRPKQSNNIEASPLPPLKGKRIKLKQFTLKRCQDGKRVHRKYLRLSHTKP